LEPPGRNPTARPWARSLCPSARERSSHVGGKRSHSLNPSSMWQKLRGDRVLHSGHACVGIALCTSPETRTRTTQHLLTRPPRTLTYAIRSFLLTDSVVYAPDPFFLTHPMRRGGCDLGARCWQPVPPAIHSLSTGAQGFCTASPIVARIPRPQAGGPAAGAESICPDPPIGSTISRYWSSCRSPLRVGAKSGLPPSETAQGPP
jgi:hypothetical protein